jgi:hypothetical protein
VNPKTTAIVLGGLIGAALGAGAAWTYMRQQAAKAELINVKQPDVIQPNAGDFLKIGVALLGLLRMFDDLFKPRK